MKFIALFSLLAAPMVAAQDSNCTSVYDIICDGDYPTDSLCDAVQTANFEDELEFGNVTLFAPVDTAFFTVPPAVLAGLLADPSGLPNLLSFHTVDDVIESSELMCEDRLFMANDESTVTICEGDQVFQVGLGNPVIAYPEITEADIEACNGIVHLISGVMLPESIVPAEAATAEPSLMPSDGPSLMPSDGPSLAPSDGPSLMPSDGPSLMPSDGPSLMPSDGPSLMPSDGPSLAPSDGPSLMPSDGPSLMPSDGPSLMPSDGPSLMPSDGPSLAPSDGPTMTPSVVPTISPTIAPITPTAAPVVPTDAPVVPTSAPVVPTAAPVAPTVPTKLPTACSTTDIACNSEQFTHLCDAIVAAELDDVFADYNRTFTIFAPTDAAFEKLGEAAMATLLDPDNIDLLTNVLAFHTIEDEMIYSEDLQCKETLEMTNGYDSRTVCRGDSVFQKGNGNTDEERPEIIAADIETCNSVLHVVDEVLLYKPPAKLGLPAPNATVPTKGPRGPTDDCKTISELVCDDPNFSVLCHNLEFAGLTEPLANGTYTLFAPNNAAFLKLPPVYVQELTENVDAMTKLLLFHTVEEEELYRSDLPCVAGENLIEMGNGKDSRTLCRNVAPRMPVPRWQKGKYNTDDDLPNFVQVDMGACNGVVHELDGVLLFENPYGRSSESSEKDRKPKIDDKAL